MLVLFGGLAIGIVCGSVALAGTSPEPQAPSGLVGTEWPRNEAGLTYGSAAKAKSPQDEPDLILAEATNGRIGYVLRTDLEGPTPRSPEEALAWQAARGGKNRVIPVYELDGVTQISVLVETRGVTTLEQSNSN